MGVNPYWARRREGGEVAQLSSIHHSPSMTIVYSCLFYVSYVVNSITTLPNPLCLSRGKSELIIFLFLSCLHSRSDAVTTTVFGSEADGRIRSDLLILPPPPLPPKSLTLADYEFEFLVFMLFDCLCTYLL